MRKVKKVIYNTQLGSSFSHQNHRLKTQKSGDEDYQRRKLIRTSKDLVNKTKDPVALVYRLPSSFDRQIILKRTHHLRKSKEVSQEGISQDAQFTPNRASYVRRSGKRNLIMSMALILRTLSSVSALEDSKDNPSAESIDKLNREKSINKFPRENPNSRDSQILLSKQNLPIFESKKSSKAKPFKEFKDEDLYNLIIKKETKTEFVDLYLSGLKSNKDLIIKSLTKNDALTVSIVLKNDPQLFEVMLSYVDDSVSFNKLIDSCLNEESQSFLIYAFLDNSKEFIEIIDKQIKKIAQKEGINDQSKEQIYKQLWQKILRQKGYTYDNQEKKQNYIHYIQPKVNMKISKKSYQLQRNSVMIL